MSDFTGESVKLTLSLGDLRFVFLPNNSKDLEKLKEGYADFLVSNGGSNILIKFSENHPPDMHDWVKVFDSGGVWRLHRNHDHWAISLSSPFLGSDPYQVLLLNENFDQGTIYRDPRSFNDQALPFEHVLAEILMVNLLAKGEGVLLHACAIQDGDTGRLFLGNSGAGKSTMSRLWANRKGVSVLSDDRVIVRKNGDCYRMYGTPWHGEARFASPRSAPIEQIFILHHGNHHHAKPLDALQASKRLLTRSFPTFWDAKGMEFTLGFLASLSQSVPCYDLNFCPEPDVVDYVRCLKSK